MCPTINDQSTAIPTGYTYVWNSGEISECLGVNRIGSYEVTVTDNFGCSSVSETFWILFINVDKVKPETILIITFPNLAGNELIIKVEEQLILRSSCFNELI